MGLSKTIETDYATNASYWRIGKTHWEKSISQTCVLNGHTTREVAISGKKPLATRRFQTSDGTPKSLTEWYQFIKTQPEFSDAEDVLE